MQQQQGRHLTGKQKEAFWSEGQATGKKPTQEIEQRPEWLQQ
jgi:hypothetical protein